MLTILVAGYKQVYIWIYRKDFLDLINMLTEKPFAPCDAIEIEIQEKFEYFIKRNTRRYLIVVMIAVVAMILMSISSDLKERNLTFKAWIPFDYSSPTVYFFVYTHQLIAMYDSAIVNVSSESLLCGFLQHICCQFEILGHRLTKVKDDQNLLGACISHHNRIFELDHLHDFVLKITFLFTLGLFFFLNIYTYCRYAYSVNDLFAKIIVAQFPVSMLVVCSNLFRLAMVTDLVSAFALVMYTNVMLVQIFNYCWFGNKVKLQSAELINSIFNIDWPDLNNSNKKDLLLMMKRTMSPIEFTAAYIISMNLESFVALLKMSYSVFNLLHQTQE
ncbi:putative odorant receptor 71a [Cardiocondyla obscurior]|uniref:putative odorant receptor 71a n=1 Tax=Cardiocondyla obscurior TaxID=286306 RepID=UPI003965629D